jgi:hypothetical protein
MKDPITSIQFLIKEPCVENHIVQSKYSDDSNEGYNGWDANYLLNLNGGNGQYYTLGDNVKLANGCPKAGNVTVNLDMINTLSGSETTWPYLPNQTDFFAQNNVTSLFNDLLNGTANYSKAIVNSSMQLQLFYRTAVGVIIDEKNNKSAGELAKQIYD